jgi:hypothetical protein
MTSHVYITINLFNLCQHFFLPLYSISAHNMNTNLYENKSGHYEHIYFIIKLYENIPGHYKHIYFDIKLYENKSGAIK